MKPRVRVSALRSIELSVLVGASIASIGVLAEEAPPSRNFDRPLTKEEARFRALDRNNDRQLSEAEFRVDATTTTEFTTLDINHDGALSMSEFVSRPIPPATTPEPK
jgi:hypothetical protein